MIEVRDLVKVYKGGVVANDRITLSIPRGSIFGLLGPNGAGKSTFVHQVLGILEPTSGEIRVDGIDVVREPERVKERYGFMPQTRLAMRELRIQDAFYYSARLRHLSRPKAREATDEIVALLDLKDHRKKAINKLSGGLHRMACFGLALVGWPELLVLDEPTNDLDPMRRRMIWDVIREANRSRGTTVVLITHNVLEAERVVDRVAMISSGRVVAEDTPGALKRKVDGSVRLEFILHEEALRNGHGSAEDVINVLSELGRVSQLEENHLILFARPDQLGETVERAMTALGSLLDDFRIAPPSLEDVYIQLEGEKIHEPVA